VATFPALFLIINSFLGCLDDSEQPFQMYLKALSNINNFHATLNILIKGTGPQVVSKKIVIWKTPTKYRLDIWNNFSDRLEIGDVRPTSIGCENCERDGWTVYKDELSDVVILLSPSKRESRNLHPMLDGVDIGLVGLTFSTYPRLQNSFYNKKLRLISPLISDPDYQGLQLIKTLPTGETIYSFHYKKTNMSVKLISSPSFGNALLTIEGSRESPIDKIKSRLVLTNSGHKKVYGNLYLPSQVKHERFENDTLTYSETFKIEIHSINEPIDPRLFTLAGMGFPNGTPVLDTEDSTRSYVVLDGKVSSTKSLNDKGFVAPIPSPTNPDAVAQPFRWYYILAAVLFSGIAVYFFRRMLNRG
jgi:hypothetical protein